MTERHSATAAENDHANGAGTLLREEVSEEDIARVVAQWTGIPVAKMLSSERAKLLELETILQRRVIGQETAIQAVRDAIRRQQVGACRHRPPARHLHLPRPHRSRQDRAGQDPGRLPVRRRARPAAHRHERVHGAPRRVAADRSASRLRRLRPGRPAHRGGAPPPLLRDPVRRAGEGAPRRVQPAAATAGRGPPHRRPGPPGGLPQQHHHHDQQPGQRPDPAGGAGGAGDAADHRAAEGELPARVPQPGGRDDHLQPPSTTTRSTQSRRSSSTTWPRACASSGSPWRSRRRRSATWPRPASTRSTGRGRCDGRSSSRCRTRSPSC